MDNVQRKAMSCRAEKKGEHGAYRRSDRLGPCPDGLGDRGPP